MIPVRKQTLCPASLLFLSIIYSVVILCPGTVANKLVSFHGMLFAAGSFILPLFFWLGCIITEIYGYAMYRKITWFAIFGQATYVLLLTIAIHLPSPSYWHHQEAYNFVIGQLVSDQSSHVVAI